MSQGDGPVPSFAETEPQGRDAGTAPGTCPSGVCTGPCAAHGKRGPLSCAARPHCPTPSCLVCQVLLFSKGLGLVSPASPRLSCAGLPGCLSPFLGSGLAAEPLPWEKPGITPQAAPWRVSPPCHPPLSLLTNCCSQRPAAQRRRDGICRAAAWSC